MIDPHLRVQTAQAHKFLIDFPGKCDTILEGLDSDDGEEFAWSNLD